jgi:hypothetical protein
MNNKLERAKVKLMLENPYFGTLVSDLKLRENENIAKEKYNSKIS